MINPSTHERLRRLCGQLEGAIHTVDTDEAAPMGLLPEEVYSVLEELRDVLDDHDITELRHPQNAVTKGEQS